MNQVLSDNRKFKAMSVLDGDALFAEIAKLELEIVKISAAGDRERARIYDKYDAMMAGAKAALPEKTAALMAYIQANPDRFVKPRARKTPNGSYGMRNVPPVLEISDADALIKWVKDNSMPHLCEVAIKLNKKNIETAISDGQEVAGAHISPPGERTFHKVSQDLMDQAKEQTIVFK